MIEVVASRSGPPCLKINGAAYHSLFDPVREAERFLEGSLGAGAPSVAVLLGEGLGYISRALTSRFPGLRVVSIQYSSEIYRAACAHPGVVPAADAWHPGTATGIADFLRERLGDLDVEGLQVIEWPAAARMFPEQSRRAQESVQQVLRELNGSIVTTVAAGKLWVRNCFANFLSIDAALSGALCAPGRPVVIAAPGPSLEEAAQPLRDVRPLVELWALPSSALFLRERDLAPDLVVITDPGFYAINHLSFAGLACPVAMPLSAARGLWRLGPAAPLLLRQPGIVEETLLASLPLEATPAAPHGTVSATALDLALAATSGPVFFAGLDLCSRDIASHARPNAFEQLLLHRSTRTFPFYGQSYQRTVHFNPAPVEGRSGARASRSLRTYAGWLAAVPAPGRVFRLFPSAVELPGMIPLDAAGMRQTVRAAPASSGGTRLRPQPGFPTHAQRLEIVQKVLAAWLDDVTEGLAAARGESGFRALGLRPSLPPLAYTLAAQHLLETKRKARLGDARGARDSAVQMLEECADFLGRMRELVSHAA